MALEMVILKSPKPKDTSSLILRVRNTRKRGDFDQKLPDCVVLDKIVNSGCHQDNFGDWLLGVKD